MNTEKEKRLQHYHNKGQEDFSKGKHDPPWGLVDGIFASREQLVTENGAYSQGWQNAKKQDKK